MTIVETRYGLVRLQAGRRAAQMQKIVEDTSDTFPRQLLPFGDVSARHYGAIAAQRERVGRLIDTFDAQIAAMARSHQAWLATHNIKNFEGTEVELLDPWRI